MSHRDLYTNEREARMLLSHLTEPSDHVVGWMVRRYGLFRTLDGILGDTWNKDESSTWLPFEREQVERARARMLPRLGTEHMRDVHARAEARGLRVVIPSDEEWPTGLGSLKERAPFCLYVRGQSLALKAEDRPISIVGARAASRYGEDVASRMAADLARMGHTIVSGAAYGIDAAAHRAALTVGRQTVAFLAGGAERAYPAGHSDLLDRMTGSGSVASEVPPGSTPTKWRFLARNRLVAAVSEGTVVIEAGARSGTMSTADDAFQLDRKVMAVPGPVTSATSVGCHNLIRTGMARMVTSAEDVEEVLYRGSALRREGKVE
jgi:DNA processing protein